MSATSDYLSRYDIDAHIAHAVPVYRHKRDLMLATMAERFPDDIHFTEPDGGLFVWLTFPAGFDATTFMADTLLPEAKVAYVPGATFFPVKQEPNHARLSFSGVPDTGSCGVSPSWADCCCVGPYDRSAGSRIRNRTPANPRRGHRQRA